MSRNLSHFASCLALFGLLTLAGCGGKSGNDPEYGDLQPVKGVVTRGGQPVKGGTIRFNPDPDKGEFMVNSEVGTDGTYSLSRV